VSPGRVAVVVRSGTLQAETPVLGATLAAALCIGWTRSAPEPFVITGLDSSYYAKGYTIQATYSLPGGGSGSWRDDLHDLAGPFAPSADPGFKCWAQARIGSRMPDCMRRVDQSEPR
jgi:hypothetical protein